MNRETGLRVVFLLAALQLFPARAQGAGATVAAVNSNVHVLGASSVSVTVPASYNSGAGIPAGHGVIVWGATSSTSKICGVPACVMKVTDSEGNSGYVTMQTLNDAGNNVDNFLAVGPVTTALSGSGSDSVTCNFYLNDGVTPVAGTSYCRVFDVSAMASAGFVDSSNRASSYGKSLNAGALTVTSGNTDVLFALWSVGPSPTTQTVGSGFTQILASAVPTGGSQFAEYAEATAGATARMSITPNESWYGMSIALKEPNNQLFITAAGGTTGASLAFPSTTVGTTSAVQTESLTNQLSSSVPIQTITASGDFAVSSNTCGASLAAGATCTIGVAFSPTAVGARAGTLTIPYTGTGSPITVALTGTGNATGLTSLAVTPTNPTILLGSTQPFTATGTFSGGVPGPQNLTTSVAWSSSAAGVATISNANGSQGLATSTGPGPTTITAALNGVNGTTTLTVTAPTLMSIAVTPANPSFAPGAAQQFTATGTYSDGSMQSVTNLVTWSSSATGVAIINASGMSTGISAGTATITAALSAVSGNTGLTVTGPSLSSIQVTPANAIIGSTKTQPYTATGKYSDNSTQNLTGLVAWSSSLTGVATITTGGLATAAGVGTTTIQASVGPYAGSTTLTVAPLFAATGNLNSARYSHTATLLTSGMVLLAGGSGASALASAELYNPASGTFASSGSMNTARYAHTATLLTNGLVLVTGGLNSSGVATNTAELYNPTTGTFTPTTGNMTAARYGHTATLLANGMVLIAGGNNGSPLASAELFNPATGTFAATTGSMLTARYSHTATLLTNGMVLVAGGSNAGVVGTAELYNPATGTFTLTTGALNAARYSHTATLLNGGMVLLAGGFNGNALNSAEVYNPATGTFALTAGSLNAARYLHSATLMDNGMVMLVGGVGASGSPLNTAESYDPTTGTIAIAGVLNTARYDQTGTLLNNGKLLMAGGFNVNAQSSAELYTPSSLVPTGLVSIALTPAAPTVGLGTTQQFIATGTWSNNSTQQLASATWSSSSTGVATITNDESNFGAVYALASGTTTVSACTGAICGSTTMTVSGGSSSGGGATVAVVNSVVAQPSVSSVTVPVPSSYNSGNGVPAGHGVIVWGKTSATSNVCGAPACVMKVTDSEGNSGYTTLQTTNDAGNGVDTFLAVGPVTTGLSGSGADSVTCRFYKNDGVTAIAGTSHCRVFDMSAMASSGFMDSSNQALGYGTSLTAGPLTITSGSTDILFAVWSVGPTPTTQTAGSGFTQILASNLPTGGSHYAEYQEATTGATPRMSITPNETWYGVSAALKEPVPSAQVFVSAAGGTTGASLSYASRGIGTTSAPQTVTVTNQLSSPLTVQTPTATGDFAVASNTCTSPVAANGSCAIGVTFTPTAIGARAGTLTIPYIGTGSPITVALSGTGNANGLTSITVTPANPAIPLGSSQQFTATGQFTTGGPQNLTAYVTWASSAPGVATISNASGSQGLATSTGQSSTTISATLNSITGSTTLTVTPPILVSITVTPANSSIAPGVAEQMTATGTYSNGTQQNLTGSVAWTSSAAGVGVINAAGMATGISAGSATITATSGAISGNTPLTVTGPTLASIQVTPANPSLGLNSTQQFAAMGIYSDSTQQDLTGVVTWSSSLTAIATITSGGMATAVGPGQSTISATLGTFAGSTTITVLPGFTATGSLNAARYSHTATLLNNGMVLVAGGTNGTPLNSAETFNPSGGTFTATIGNLTAARFQHTATLLPNGTVLLVGGATSSGAATNTAELFNPVTGTFAATTGTLITARYGHTATLLPNGMVLIAGGLNASGSATNTAELFNPATGTFTATTGTLNAARYWHTATLLNNGLVLLAGGLSGGALTTAELYNPATGTFTATGNLATARYFHTATLLNNGMVLMAGGYNGSYLTMAELYDPAATTFAVTGSLAAGRYLQTATLLKNGLVLVAGGYNGSPLASAAQYAPQTVTPPNLVSITVTPAAPTVGAGTAQQFIATGTMSDNSAQQLASVAWSISNGVVAMISNDKTDSGVAYGLGTGTATVTACAGAICGSTTLTVPPPAGATVAAVNSSVHVINVSAVTVAIPASYNSGAGIPSGHGILVWGATTSTATTCGAPGCVMRVTDSGGNSSYTTLQSINDNGNNVDNFLAVGYVLTPLAGNGTDSVTCHFYKNDGVTPITTTGYCRVFDVSAIVPAGFVDSTNQASGFGQTPAAGALTVTSGNADVLFAVWDVGPTPNSQSPGAGTTQVLASPDQGGGSQYAQYQQATVGNTQKMSISPNESWYGMSVALVTPQ